MRDRARRDVHRLGKAASRSIVGEDLARLTGLEPATPGVTGRYSNQLSYNRVAFAGSVDRGKWRG